MKGGKRAKKKVAPRGKRRWGFDLDLTATTGRVRRGPKRRPPSKKSVQTLSRALARRLAVREPGTGDRDVQGVSARVQGVSGAEMVVVRPGSKLYYVKRKGEGTISAHVLFGMFTSHQRAAGFMDHRDKTQLTLRPWREMYEVSWMRVIA